jgi:hypothetical protein
MPMTLSARVLQMCAGDGRGALRVSALSLCAAGLFAILLGATGRFLPHDEAFLSMSAQDLCALHGCRIVHFMVHDRLSFGGALVAVGLLYAWLTDSPLKRGQAWAWWLLLISGGVGFASFFAYLGYGYLDTWHSLATLALLPCFALGLMRSWPMLAPQRSSTLFQPAVHWGWRSPAGLGRTLLLMAAAGITAGGLTILTVGMTCVFVPQDLTFMDLSVAELDALNPRLVPLIAHDRAGFGGAVCCAGVAIFCCVWRAAPSAGFWWILVGVGVAGFGAGIGAHPAVGYLDPLHLAPAVLGAVTYAAGLALTFPAMAMKTRVLA